MADQRKLIFTATLNADEVTQELQEVAKTADTTQDAVSQGISAIDDLTGGMVSSFKSAKTGLKGAVAGMKTFKGAIAATGIGLLVIAVGSLVSYFTKTQRGADLLEKATAGLGAVMGILTDRVSALGEILVNAFNDPIQSVIDLANSINDYVIGAFTSVFDGIGLIGTAISQLFQGDFKGAAESAKKGFTKINDGVTDLIPATAIIKAIVPDLIEVAKQANEAANAAAKLAKRSIQLRNDQRALRKEMSEGRAEIKEYNLIAEDTTKGTEERIEAAEKAIKIEKDLMDERVKLAQEELDIQLANMALSESIEEDFERQTELEVALAGVRMESFEMQTTLNNKLNTIRQQATAEAEATIKAEAEALEAQFTALEKYESTFLDAQTKQVDAIAKKYDALLDEAAQYGFDEQALIDQQNAEVAAINKKYSDEALKKTKEDADKEKALAKSVHDSKLAMAGNAIGALIAINSAFVKDNESSAKKQFNRNKALGIASATINTYAAVADALAKDATFPGSRFIAAAAAGATGLAQIIKIKSTQFDNGSASPSIGSIRLPQGGESGGSLPGLDLGFLGEGSGTQLGRTYVVSQEVTNNQQANQLVTDQASLYQ